MKVSSSISSGSYDDPVSRRSSPRAGLFVLGLVIALGIGFILGSRYDNLLSSSITGGLDYSELDEIYKTLGENYDGEIDDTALIEGAKRGMVEGLGDEYTQYFSYDDSQEFYSSLEGSFEGIGAELMNKDGQLTINNVLDDTPAQRAGLRAGDIISRVDNTDTITWSAESAVQIIRGEAGTNVKLMIIRGHETIEFTVTRAKITSPSVTHEIRDGIGYLRVGRFSDTDTTQLVRQAAKAFVDANVSGIVLDLRGNGGGYVSVAVDLASLWLERGQVVVSEKAGDIVASTETASGNNVLSGTPTVVLIDGNSASASEIVAGALSDHEAATLVGKQSFGKGSVQIMKELRSGSQLKITIAKWYTPDGTNINLAGIKPDVDVDFDSVQYENGVDTQELKAVEVLKSR